MSPMRPSTPPPLGLHADSIQGLQPLAPASGDRSKEGSVVTGPQNTRIPPSPRSQTFSTSNGSEDEATCKLRANTGAGVKQNRQGQRKAFRFLDLPGEIRNLIYDHACGNPRQALLVHRPRLASLRPRTRQDRSRPLASEVAGYEHDKELELLKSRRSMQRNIKVGSLARESNRPFFGLTQVCRAIRHEYRPLYLRYQEIGMDLTETVKYLQTFYANAEKDLATIETSGIRKHDLPFTGNLTIAVGGKPNAIEREAHGIDIFPLLDIWANSYKIEAGFGRYMSAFYIPEADGEAKDLYRLFGRRVLLNRTCSGMNTPWRTILRSRSLAAIFVHREPSRPVTRNPRSTGALPQLTQHPLANDGAYIHIVFKKAFAEPWMTGFESTVPADWLMDRGFDNMEFFDLKVGVEIYD